MLSSRLLRLIIAVWFILLAPTSWAATTLVTVASDFTKPMTEIAAEFEKATGHTAKLSFGSSGKAFAQIQSGGPFEVYLSASEKYPLELEKTGFYLIRAAFVSGSLSLPAVDAAIGTPLRVQIYASDVSIALEVPVATSILNVLPATITGLADDSGGQSVWCACRSVIRRCWRTLLVNRHYCLFHHDYYCSA
jgi:ABC-type molybdate transport system substrate-binding protein